jgi:glycosyltransferase involved in cell wall biosynthesis
VTQLNRSSKSAEPKIIAAIPCLNEGQFISEIVTKARRYVDRVIVVDDGSTDNTSEAAQAAGAEVIRHKKRQGAGAATRSAFEAAKKYHADVLITLDGDGQHDPDEIPQMLAPVLSGNADLVIGSRFLEPIHRTRGTLGVRRTNIRRYREFGINVITWLYNLGSKVKLSDSQSCFRSYSRRLFEALNITENGFGFSVEVLIQARGKNFIIREIPISCVYHSQGSSLNPVVHGLDVAWRVVKLRFINELLTPKRRNRDEPKK